MYFKPVILFLGLSCSSNDPYAQNIGRRAYVALLYVVAISGGDGKVSQ